jgi:hypothetical protein
VDDIDVDFGLGRLNMLKGELMLRLMGLAKATIINITDKIWMEEILSSIFDFVCI